MASLLPLGLLACAEHASNPIEVGTACIYEQVPKGEKVSADRARQVVNDCAKQLDAWSRFSIEGSFKRPFDETDHSMSIAFSKHRVAAREYWLTQLSDEIKPSSYRL